MRDGHPGARSSHPPHHWSGKKNTYAEPVLRPESAPSNQQALEVVAATSPSWESAEGGEPTLSTLQRNDPQLAPIVEYLEKGELPADDKRAHELALTKLQYTIVDRVLYRVESDKTLRVIPPTSQREKILHEAHGGRLGTHVTQRFMVN